MKHLKLYYSKKPPSLKKRGNFMEENIEEKEIVK